MWMLGKNLQSLPSRLQQRTSVQEEMTWISGEQSSSQLLLSVDVSSLMTDGKL
jgi:hypothetical protein